jgi:hypothetical protein
MPESAKILIVAKTYPVLSVKYKELVCTGGVRENGSFVRLYPIDFRYRPYWEWYKKYQWIKVDIEKNPKDPRPESFRPISRITPLGPPLSTKNAWAERKKYVMAQGVTTMCKLRREGQNVCSFGIIRPREVLDLKIQRDSESWNPRTLTKLSQLNLFGPQQKQLEKIPYKFRYVFYCEDPKCKGHKESIIDWEVGRLFLRLRNTHQSEEIAIEKVKDKLLTDLCSDRYDMHFFVSTILQYGSWVVVGLFYPPR